MAKNVLIDTCVLKELVSLGGFSGYLKQIAAWCKNGDIVLFCPKTLKDEWEVHRKKELKSIEEILKVHEHTIATSELFNVAPEIGDAQLSAADKLLRSQVDTIDLLLAESRQVKDELGAAQAWLHKDQNKAPFHEKKDSWNDAIILFSTLEELRAHSESELFFLSTNHTDYSAKGLTKDVHPHISAAYSGMDITYFSDLATAIHQMVELGMPSAKAAIVKAGKVKELIVVNREKTLLEQLYDYLDRRFGDIRFLPKKLFCRHYPFIIGEKDDSHYRPFTVTTDNKALYDLFVNSQRQDAYYLWSGTDEGPDSKLAEVFMLLRGNLVHSVAYQNGRSIDLPLVHQPACNCLVCSYRAMNFTRSLAMLQEISAAPEVTLKTAYSYFLHGKITKASEILKMVAVQAEVDMKWLTLYIANYNLVLIGRLMRHRSVDDSAKKAMFEELRNISLSDVYIKCQSASLNDILDYLKESRFMNDALVNVRDIVAKIKDYQSDQHGGWNDNTRLLLDLYFETVGVVELDYILIGEFSEIGTLTNYFAEGLFASYASRKDLGGKLLYFTGPIVEKLITYGRHDEFIKYRRRYDIKIADYQIEGGYMNFVDQLISQMESYPDALAHYQADDNEGQQFFWSNYRRAFHNAMTMSSMLRISSEEVNRICEKLFPFLAAEKHFHEFELTRTLTYFIRNNAQLIDQKHLEAFILFAYTSQNIHRDELVNALSDVARSRPFTLKLTHEQWETLESVYMVNDELKKEAGTINEICCLYDFLTIKPYKEEIAKFLLYYLKNEFDPKIYYWAVMHNLVKPTKAMTHKFEASVIKLAKEGQRVRPFEAGFYHDHRLDEFINFSLRLNRPLNHALIEALIKLDDYYRWLTNPDEFDYSLFDPEWLFNHYTMYFKQMFKASMPLQQCLRKLALKSSDYHLGQLYIDVYTAPLD